ncbi:MAG: hypothetical protein ABL911_08945 [Gallionella sp.]
MKKTRWSDQIQVVPINRESSSDQRDIFSEAVFNLPKEELADLWNKLRFEGKHPPLTQISDHAVVAFVRSVPGAIGYISDNETPTGVKVLLRLQ